MPQPNWNIIAASVAGTSHAAKNESCQDAYSFQIIKNTLVAVVSDGAGSAKNGLDGAQKACAFFQAELTNWLEKGGKPSDLNREAATVLLKSLQTEITKEAENNKISIADYACTLLATIIGENAAVFFQIGDGIIVYSLEETSDEYHLATLPQQGEYANSTNFVTDEDAFDVLHFEMLERRVDEIAMMTDGLQRIALNYQTQTAHAPFFRPMFAPLRAANLASNLETKLTEFLDSPKINERTDDDKTLILASRRTD
jgi:serine/threonine protein phosphatase PrpC